jgi:iron complex transport system substrate-binding protein
VTLDEAAFEYAVSLGLHPVGTTISEISSSYLSRWLVGVEDIGQAGEANLERVLALKPDLILGFDYYRRVYAQASQIAPTVLLTFEHSGEWKNVLQRFSVVLNREAIAQQLMEHYNRRLRDLQEALKVAADSMQTPPNSPQISAVRIYPDSINLYLRDSFCGVILQDAGLARPNAQNLSALEAKQRFGNEIQVSISVEQVDQADGDVMFIWTSENTEVGNQTARQKLAKLQAMPLWKHLNVMKSNRVYFVPDYWIGSGPLAADRVIDDLFKYLIQEQGA